MNLAERLLLFLTSLTATERSVNIYAIDNLLNQSGLKPETEGECDMMLSTKGKYGLQAVLDLALHSEESAVPLNDIAKRQDISISYLEQLMAKLRKAEIVNSIRGAQGGYVLAKSPSDISVGEILRALEGNLNPIKCNELSGEKGCSSADSCVTKFVWKRISDSINDTVNKMLLSELVEESRRIVTVHRESVKNNDKWMI